MKVACHTMESQCGHLSILLFLSIQVYGATLKYYLIIQIFKTGVRGDSELVHWVHFRISGYALQL